MESLKHWDNALSFTGRDISLLAMGVDPSSEESRLFNTEHLLELIRNAYIDALWRARYQLGLSVGMRDDLTGFDDPVASIRTLKSIDLLSYDCWSDQGLEEEFVGWLLHEKSAFEFQKFSRSEVVRWLTANNVSSEYLFDKQNPYLAHTGALTPPDSALEPTADPGDRPPELDVGLIAFQAVKNGFGNPNETFRKRLVQYLKTHYGSLKNDAVQRIATVANPDKTTGRKKSVQE